LGSKKSAKSVVRPRSDDSAAHSTDRRGDAEISQAGNASQLPRELGGPKGPDPTRYGDWERGGRCIDF
jgi:hypothetical protein